MKEFLEINFSKDMTTTNVNIDQLLNSTESLEMHSTLIKHYQRLQHEKRELHDKFDSLADMQRHIVWAMYFNWIEDEIVSEKHSNNVEEVST
jgi:hypothetical protein